MADIKLVSMKAYKAQRKIYPEDVNEVSGETFIRLKISNRGLIQLVFDDNDLAPPGTIRSLSGSIGLKQTVADRKRSKALADKAPKSNLFADADAGNEEVASWGSLKRVQIKEKRRADHPAFSAIASSRCSVDQI